MAKISVVEIQYAERALEDLERLAEFLMMSDLDAAIATTGLITEAISLLARHPLLGRLVGDGLRELLISRGRTGYAALYTLPPEVDQVHILSIRHQREVGY